MTGEQLGLVFAERDRAIDAVNRHADDWEKSVVDTAILTFAATGRPFSANTFRDLLPEIRNRALIGARIRSLAMRRPAPFVKVGEVVSTDPGTHAKKIGLYAAGGER